MGSAGISQERSDQTRCFSISLFLWDHPAHATAGVGDVANITGDEVDMEVGHALPGGSADIDPDVPSVRMVAPLQDLSAAAEKIEKGPTLLLSRFEERGYMPERDDEGVARTHREGVGPRVGESVLQDDVIGGRVAEGAGASCPVIAVHTKDSTPGNKVIPAVKTGLNRDVPTRHLPSS